MEQVGLHVAFYKFCHGPRLKYSGSFGAYCYNLHSVLSLKVYLILASTESPTKGQTIPVRCIVLGPVYIKKRCSSRYK